MERTSFYCDICEKEINQWVDIQIEIGDSRKWDKKGSPFYKNSYHIIACDDCIGSEIERRNGSHGRFGIKDYGVILLKKLKIIK